jgi:DNA polymerase I
MDLTFFKEVWVVDFEFYAPDGEIPRPVCLVAFEIKSGRTIRIWRDELLRMKTPPYSIGPDSLFVAFYASAELNCHIALGWYFPVFVLDLFVEYRNLTNGILTPNQCGLIPVCDRLGISHISLREKEAGRSLAMRGITFSEDEQDCLLKYCESDVVAEVEVLKKMLPKIDLPCAIHLRGRYMKAVARMEYVGTPIDMDVFQKLRINWGRIRQKLVNEVDSSYGVYAGTTFKTKKFEKYLISEGIQWPRLEFGRLNLEKDTFKDMAEKHPQLERLRELRKSLSQLTVSKLAVGSDGRNRCMLSPFSAKTGRNQPSTSKFIFGPAKWMRCLIKPKLGFGIAYIDYEKQEFGIAAALSGDTAMITAYESGDPYLAFGKQTGLIPPDGDKNSHAIIRDFCKTTILGLQYSMSEFGLARKLDVPVLKARELLDNHRRTYRRFWEWNEMRINQALLELKIESVFGWTLNVTETPNLRSLGNFPMQANGAEITRLACCMATEQGIRVCCSVHDALLIEAPLEELNAAVQRTQRIMEEASAIVLDGFSLRTDVEIVQYPDRYRDKRETGMWDLVLKYLERT